MAKKNIHPTTSKVKITSTSGEVYELDMCSKAKSIILDIDPAKHPAWNREKKNYVNATDADVSKFNDFFGDISDLD
jgi:ribosomal protein L31